MGLLRKLLSRAAAVLLNVFERDSAILLLLGRELANLDDGDDGEVRGCAPTLGESNVILLRLSSSGSERAALPEASA
jgi:hypothetical protein